MAPKKGKSKKEVQVKVKVKMPPKRPPGWKSKEEEDEDEEEEEEEEEAVEEEEVEEEEEEVEEEEEEQEEVKSPLTARKSSLLDVEGAVPKSTLRKLSNRALRQLILHARREIERYDAENYLFERTIDKLEKPEKDIDDMYHSTDSMLNINANAVPQICSSESEEEPDDSGEFVPIKPLDEIHISTDSFFDNMSDNSKGAAIGYFANIGEIAPLHFDVMRFKYGDMVKGAPEEVEQATDIAPKGRSLGSQLLERPKNVDDKKNPRGSRGSIKSPTPSTAQVHNTTLGLATMLGERLDEDQEYPGFSMATAKELSVRDKLRFAMEEEEEFRNEFYKFETQALKEEGAVQIYVDAHKHSIRLLLNLRKDFKSLMRDARHPVTGRLMAELILRFKRKMRNSIAAEDTKTRMTIRNVVSVKKRALHQLKTNRESGNSISQIDFEHLMTENQIFQDDMEEMNLSLKYLKQLSGHFFQILKEDQDSIERLNQEDFKLGKEIDTKRKVMKNFDKTYNRYKNLIAETSTRMEELKKKLSEYHAPQPLEYIHLKAVQYEMESDVATLQKKLDEINLSLITARSTFAKYCKLLPGGDQTELENQNWLDFVKREVEENNLLSILDDDEDMKDGELPDAFKPKGGWSASVTAAIADKSDAAGRPKTGKSGRGLKGKLGNKLARAMQPQSTKSTRRYSGGMENNVAGGGQST